jgi:hypothetical protein
MLLNLPDDLLSRLPEVSGNELKVWMFHFLLSNQSPDLQCSPSNDDIAAGTGLSERTVKVSKRNLIKKDWLQRTGQYRPAKKGDCLHPVPIMEAVVGQNLPEGQNLPPISRGKNCPQVVLFSGSMFSGSPVSPSPPSSAFQVSQWGEGGGLVAAAPPYKILKSKAMVEEKERENRKPLEPKAEPKPTPTPPKPELRVIHAPDGTRCPKEWDTWKNADRLYWLEAHGHKFGGGKQDRNKAKAEWKPKAVDSGKGNHAQSPRSAAPQFTKLAEPLPCKAWFKGCPAKLLVWYESDGEEQRTGWRDGWCPECVDKGWDKEISKPTPEWVSNIMDEESDLDISGREALGEATS